MDVTYQQTGQKSTDLLTDQPFYNLQNHEKVKIVV